ncbi:MAG: chemotaxis protein CheB, partial [Thermoanaerobaculia bacterium]|nr:chemotaxis protein CheB [Thermoanaerobaculia bacterium]
FARPSIDTLFESAADSWGSRASGVLLTAASSDGAEGIAAIAAARGTTIVQSPESAESPIAVRAALAATEVDHVLPLDQIAPILDELVNDVREGITNRKPRSE